MSFAPCVPGMNRDIWPTPNQGVLVPNWTGCLSSHRLHGRFRPYHRMRVLPPKMMITRMADIARIAARLKTSRMRSGGAPNSLRTMIEAANKMTNLISRILRGEGAFLSARPSAASITSDWSPPSSALRPHLASRFSAEEPCVNREV